MDGKEERRPRRAAEVPVAAWRRGSVQKAVPEQHVVWRKRLRHDPMVGPGRHGLDNNWVVLCLGAGRISMLWVGPSGCDLLANYSWLGGLRGGWATAHAGNISTCSCSTHVEKSLFLPDLRADGRLTEWKKICFDCMQKCFL